MQRAGETTDMYTSEKDASNTGLIISVLVCMIIVLLVLLCIALFMYAKLKHTTADPEVQPIVLEEEFSYVK